MEASAGASSASTGAGTGSAQSVSSSSQQSASNSAGQTSTTQRRSAADGAPPSSSQHPAQAAPATQPADDDPELDFGERGKFKRSQILQDFNRMRASQQAEAKARAEAIKRAEAAEAYKQHLQRLGVDPDAFAKDPDTAMREYSRQWLQQQIAEAQMDPKELELQKRESQLTDREKQIKAHEEQQKQTQHQAQVRQHFDEFAGQMSEALEQSNLPRNAENVARMASLMLAAARKGVRIPKEQLAQLVARRIADEQAFHFNSLHENPDAAAQWLQPHLPKIFSGKAAALLKAIGPQLADELRKELIKQHQDKFDQPTTNNNKPRTPRTKIIESKDHPNGYISYDSVFGAGRRR